MTTAQFNALTQMITALSVRVEEIAENQKNFLTKEDAKLFATKKDLERFATKKDLEQYATKKDLERFATKQDLEQFATKQDLAEMSQTILKAIEKPFAELSARVDSHDVALEALDTKVSKLLHARA